MTTKEAVVVEEESPGAQALAVVSRDTGVMALAYMSEDDFNARLVALKQGQDRIRLIQKELMEVDEDYGVIPGTKKPTLLKPGAEKLCNVYGLVPTFDPKVIEGDGTTSPHLRVQMQCYLHKGTADGPVVGVGIGAANSWERKHRYRGAQRSCPSCGCEGTIRRSRFEDRQTGEKGWYCHDKAGGCGEQFAKDDPRIAQQQVGLVENKDPYDVENTLLKMAEKRAYIDATLRATATSGLFTQDLEDMQGGASDSGDDGAAAGSSRAAAARASAPAPTAEREPGSDDDVIETTEGPVKVGGGARAAVAGAQQNDMFDPNAPADQGRPPAPAGNGGAIPPCPQGHSGRAVMASRKPQYGAYYCHTCSKGYGPKGGAR